MISLQVESTSGLEGKWWICYLPTEAWGWAAEDDAIHQLPLVAAVSHCPMLWFAQYWPKSPGSLVIALFSWIYGLHRLCFVMLLLCYHSYVWLCDDVLLCVAFFTQHHNITRQYERLIELYEFHHKNWPKHKNDFRCRWCYLFLLSILGSCFKSTVA